MRKSTMNDFANKWDEISEIGHSAGRFRVFPDHPMNFFLDFSLNGKREVIIEVEAEALNIPSLPVFRNIDLSVTKIHSSIRFVMILDDDDLSQSFNVMCYDLAQRSKRGKTVVSAMNIFLNSLNQWAELFKKKPSDGLSRSETIGLFGELVVIERLILQGSIDSDLIIRAWSGPDGDARDIGFNGSRIEVKTQFSTKAVSINISSLDQLDDYGDKVYVVLNRISPSDNGDSLIDIVGKLRQLLKLRAIASDEFEIKLRLASFDKESAYANEKFGLDVAIVYLVNDSFPRLIRQSVPQGIVAANYEVRGQALESHKISWEDLFGALNG